MTKEINCVNCVKNKPGETWHTCKRKCSYKYKKREQDAEYQLKLAKQECETLVSQLDLEVQKRKCLGQECEKLKAIVTEAEEAPICFHCSEEPCIRQERDKYKRLSVDFKNVNKYLGHKYITLKQALDEIQINISEYQGLTLGKPRTMRENDCIYKILDIIKHCKEVVNAKRIRSKNKKIKM